MDATCAAATPEPEYDWYGPNVRHYRNGDMLVCQKFTTKGWKTFKTLNTVSNDYAYTEARRLCSAQAVASIGTH